MQRLTIPVGVSVDEIVERYWRFLSRNEQYALHFAQFKRRYQADRKSAEAEAIMFSLLRAEKLNPDIFEDPGTGGPDFRCDLSPGESFLVEVTSLDSASVSKKSGLPLRIDGAGGGAYGLITEKLLSAAKNKADQLGGHDSPGVLAITSDYDFAGLLLDRMAAEYLMTSAPQINVPLDGRPHYMTTDLRNAVFCNMSLLDASGNPIISPRRRSISAILLIAIHSRESRVVGLLHPEPASPFDPHWLPRVPYLRFQHWPITGNKAPTEWILGEPDHSSATFEHRLIR
jgi:hypothetical protein